MKKTWLLGMLFLSACSHSNDNNALRPKAVQKAQTCAEFRSSLPADIAQGFVTVPESPGSDHSLQVFYYYRKPLRGRIALFLNGGPGGSSHSSYTLMEKALKAFGVADQITFVYMDQRGNGCSSPYPEATTDAELFERGKWYGSRGIVSDAEAIRRTLGLSTWSIFGQSYGAFIAHRYAILAPASLDRIMAYANTITPDSRMRMSGRMASQIDVWNAYFAVHPEDRAKMQTLLTTLSMDVCTKVQDYDDCGHDLIDSMVSVYLGFHDEWPKLHTWFEKILPNGVLNRDQLTSFANMFQEPSTIGRSRSLNAVNYYDRDTVFYNFSTCSNARVDSGNAVAFDATLTECAGALQQKWSTRAADRTEAYFKGSRDLLTLADFRQTLLGHAKNWFLLYSADLDPYVPSRSFKPELDAVSDLLSYRNFPDVGHDGYYTKKEVFDDFLAP